MIDPKNPDIVEAWYGGENRIRIHSADAHKILELLRESYRHGRKDEKEGKPSPLEEE
jgi:hypothetical protein